MFTRVFFFALALALGLVLGAVLGQDRAAGWGAALGVAAAAVLVFALDVVWGLRAADWLRHLDGDAQPPRLPGLWGEVVDRVRRALRHREQQAAEAQRRIENFLAAIQASPNGVTLLDGEGRITWCNQTASAHFGFDVQRDHLQRVGNLVRDPAFTAYLEAGDFTQEVVIANRAVGGGRSQRVSAQLHPYGEGNQLLLSRDVTALEQADTMRRDFVANVSHEIRTPLTVLNGFVETLRNLPLEEGERTRYLALMAQQAQRMEALVDDLLTLSRLEGSAPPGTGGWTALPGLLAQCEQEARGLAETLGKSLEITCVEAPPLELSGAPAEILSAMTNLATNAVRYTPNGGTVSLRCRLLPDDRLEFSVHDTGPGIPPEHLPRLTERFYRVDRSRSRETGGTGLGLAIVKHAVQRHGGDLQIESTPGQGSRFSFWLPASRVRPAA